MVQTMSSPLAIAEERPGRLCLVEVDRGHNVLCARHFRYVPADDTVKVETERVLLDDWGRVADALSVHGLLHLCLFAQDQEGGRRRRDWRRLWRSPTSSSTSSSSSSSGQGPLEAVGLGGDPEWGWPAGRDVLGKVEALAVALGAAWLLQPPPEEVPSGEGRREWELWRLDLERLGWSRSLLRLPRPFHRPLLKARGPGAQALVMETRFQAQGKHFAFFNLQVPPLRFVAAEAARPLLPKRLAQAPIDEIAHFAHSHFRLAALQSSLENLSV